jgi:hypothetical protein
MLFNIYLKGNKMNAFDLLIFVWLGGLLLAAVVLIVIQAYYKETERDENVLDIFDDTPLVPLAILWPVSIVGGLIFVFGWLLWKFLRLFIRLILNIKKLPSKIINYLPEPKYEVQHLNGKDLDNTLTNEYAEKSGWEYRK